MTDKSAHPDLTKLEPRIHCEPTHTDQNSMWIEDSLEPNLRDFIKTVHSAYLQSFTPHPSITNQHLPASFFFDNYQQYNQAYTFLNIHTTQSASFLQKSLSCFKCLSANDQIKVLANSVHILRLMQLANDSSSSVNYFNVDERSFNQICRVMPVFRVIEPYLKSLSDLIRGLKLDSKEFALYSALVALSSGYNFLFQIYLFLNNLIFFFFF